MPRVKGAQEGFAAVAESLPCVFAVEDERDQAGLVRDEARDVRQVVEQMARGFLRVVLRGGEADEIRERPLAEEGVHRRAVIMDAPALEELEVIDLLARIGRVALEGVEEVFLVGAEILDAGLLHERDEFRRDGALAGPEAARCFAEQPFVLLDRERQLRRGVLRANGSAAGNLRPGQAALGECGIVNQRQDRVKKRRGRQLDLAARLRGGVALEDDAQDFQVDVEDAVFFLLGEVAALGAECRQFRVKPVGGVAAPGEVVPDLEVENFLRGEVARGRGGPRRGRR